MSPEARVPTITRDATDDGEDEDCSARALPGVVVVHSQGRAVLRVLPLVRGSVVVGRADAYDDGLVSREHVELVLADGRWQVTDLASRNGTHVDGERLRAHTPWTGPRPEVVRVGQTLLLAVADVSGWPSSCVRPGNPVVAGANMGEAFAAIQQAAQVGDNLLVQGESGTGKELAAAAFHAARGAGPLIAVNCAAIPTGMAERLFLGARRGSYSGATSDAPGYFEAAEGGVLFLDEIGELEPELQAKLLRVLESREVLPLGATRPRQVRFSTCCATNRDLAGLVASERFRADLYYRIARPTVRLPPLRERREEIPFLIERALGESGLPAHPRLVEICLRRPWPGNVRELLAEVRIAAGRARREDAGQVKAQHLAEQAGQTLAPVAEVAPQVVEPGREETRLERERLVEALAAAGHNVSAAAVALGMHRTQLYREIRRLAVPVRRQLDSKLQ